MLHLSRMMCLIVCGATLSGCSTSAYFVTKTSLAIVDVDSTPGGASIAYDRVEGLSAPLNDNGTLPPVVAKIQTDGNLLKAKVKQIYATGDAAEMIAAGSVKSKSAGKGDRQAVAFFGTSTTTGLKVGFSPAGVPDSFLLGFKRKEISVVPSLRKGSDGNYVYPQLLAALDTNARAAPNNEAGLDICQSFASGEAAVELAKATRDGIDSLSCGGASTKELLGDYYQSTARQTETKAGILMCYSGVSEPDRTAVWEDAARLGVLMSTVDGDADEKNAAALAMLVDADAKADKITDERAKSNAKRQQDARYAALLSADPGGAMKDGKLLGNATRERLLEIHEEFVCSRSAQNQPSP